MAGGAVVVSIVNYRSRPNVFANTSNEAAQAAA